MSNFSEKYRSFMARRNGPDQLARDALVVALVFIVISVFCANTVRAVLLAIGIAFMVYSYWRLFSTKVADRSRENSAYLAKRNQLLGKVRQPLERAGKKGQQAATRAKDKDHRYFADGARPQGGRQDQGDLPQVRREVREEGLGRVRSRTRPADGIPRYPSTSNVAEALLSSSIMGRCWGHTASQAPHATQSRALVPARVA